MLPVESVFTLVKLVILILPRLNMHSDELEKLFWSLENNQGQVRISFGYYTRILIDLLYSSKQ